MAFMLDPNTVGVYDSNLLALLGEVDEGSDKLATRLEKLNSLIDRLPDLEADAVYLHYGKGKKQSDIAHIFGITQAAVSYRLKRARRRLEFFLSIPSLTSAELRSRLEGHFTPHDIEILVGISETTCQSKVAEALNLTQGRVRHRFFRAVRHLDALRKVHPTLEDPYQLFSKIADHGFNLAREVSLPQWSDRSLNRLELVSFLFSVCMGLQIQKFQFSHTTSRGVWRWMTVADLTAASASYRIEDIFSPYGRLRDSIPLDGDVVVQMGQSITTVQQAFAPSILVTPPGMLTFTVDEGRGVSADQTFVVTNNGIFGSFLSVSASPADPFVAVNPPIAPGILSTASYTFRVNVDSTNLLASGSPYATGVTLNDPLASNGPITVPVQIVVRSKATISLSTLALNFTVVKPLTGSFPPIADQTVTLSNTGLPDSVLEFLAQKLTGLSPWLTGIVPTSGSVTGGSSQVLTFSVVPPDSLLTGTYTEVVRVSGYSTNNYADITVTLQVT